MNIKPTQLVAALVLVMVTGAACKSEKRSAYEALAERINPLLIRIVPTVSAMNGIIGDSPDATARVVDVCKTADDALWLLRDVREDDERIRRDYDSGKLRTSEVARWMLDSRPVNCRSPDGAPHRLTMCRDWCREMWGNLVSAADRLRAAAAREGIEIVSLSSTPN